MGSKFYKEGIILYQKGKKIFAMLAVVMMLFGNTVGVFGAENKGYLLPVEQMLVDRCDAFAAFLNDNLMQIYGTENAFPLIINIREIQTPATEDTALYQGQWGAATIAIFADKQTQRLESVALILPRDYVLEGYSQEGADYFACVGILSGFFNGANNNGVYGKELREGMDFFGFDFNTLQSQSVEIGNLDYYYEVGAGSISFIITGIPQ